MRRIEAQLQRLWRGEPGWGPRIAGLCTIPLSLPFGGAVRLRNALYDTGILSSYDPPLPVMSVGNLAVGGTGKTPVSAWLVRVLVDGGWRPALVRRGYGQDERLLHERWNPATPVIHAADRRRGVHEARERGCNIVVLDDGFQHRALRRTVDVVLLSPRHPFPPRLLPRGPYREGLTALGRADHVLITVKGASERTEATALQRRIEARPDAPPVDLFEFEVGDWEDLRGRPTPAPSGTPLVVTSVAEPQGFLELVQDRTQKRSPHLGFRDHHAFSAADARRIALAAGSRWIATTEKDAVKLLPLQELLPPVRVLPLVPAPDAALARALLQRLPNPSPPQHKGTNGP